MNQKLGFLYFRGIHNSLQSFWAKLGYSRIKIDHIADSLLKLQIKIGVHLINGELSQLLTLKLTHLQIEYYASSWMLNSFDAGFKISCDLKMFSLHFYFNTNENI